MHEFAVWAPDRERVDVHVGPERVEMSRAGDGWWRAAVEGAGPGTRYGFSLDRGPVRPDPRSASQPEGVEGLSEVVDHGRFTWRDRDWRGVTLRGAVLYELHIGTFSAGATFDSAIEHLPHLVDLGVDAVELMPVAEFPGARGWGYDGVDLFAPHHAYGGPDGLKRLVDACHATGLGVVIDVVYNHLGPAGNYLAEYGPYFSDRHRTNWGDAVNFAGRGSQEVRRFVVDNALMWYRDYHADGLRLDAVHAIVDDSAKPVLEYLAEEVDALAAHVRKPLFVIAESDLNDPRFVRSRDTGGLGLDAAWADEWHHALHAALTGERSGYYGEFGSLTQLAKALRQAWVYDGTWSPHRQRHHGRRPTGLTGHQFVVSTQNHDQVGNRALGERTSALASEGRLKIAAALLMTSPFTPMLFQGEEWGARTPFQYFTDHSDPELGRAVCEGRRTEFAPFEWDPVDVPDPQSPQTFYRSRLDWQEPSRSPHDALLDWYRTLIALRRRRPELSDPRLSRVTADANEALRTIVVARGRLGVLVNLSNAGRRFEVDGLVSVLVASEPDVSVKKGEVLVPPDALAIIEGGCG
jgi:maltooligosyltrehalose trehalohydrolase